jgi:hypothetical protein
MSFLSVWVSQNPLHGQESTLAAPARIPAARSPVIRLVDKQNHLQADQLDRGREWGTHLATALARRS